MTQTHFTNRAAMQAAKHAEIERLKHIRAFLLDMDGTFYIGGSLIDGSMRFLDALRATGRKAMFLTNNSSRSASAYREKLRRMGVAEDFLNVYTSGNAAASVLLEDYPGKRVYALATAELTRELLDAGVNVVTDGADTLLIGYDTSLTYDKLCIACDLARAGVPYIATHPDFNCPGENGPLPDIGAIIAFIEASTGRKPDMVIGKPNAGLIHEAIKRLAASDMSGASDISNIPNISIQTTAMVGDRLYTDIAAGRNAGVLSICVLSGEATLKDIEESETKPDLVFDRLSDMIDYF